LHLKDQQEQFSRKQEAIERELIKNLESFTSEQYAECAKMIQKVVSETKYKVTGLVGNCREEAELEVSNIIFSTKNKAELKTVLENKISPILNNAFSTLDIGLKTATGELNLSFARVKQHFDEKFSKQYSNLQTLSTKANLDTTTIYRGTIQVGSYNMISVVSELSKITGDASNMQVGVGVGAGATIGTIIFPGVGTIVGAALGGIFGSLLGPSLSELQNSCWEKIQPKTQYYFNSVEEAIEQSLENYSQQMITGLNKHIDTYIATYQKIVKNMQQEQNERKEILNRLQQEIKSDLLEINTRIQSLKVS